MVFFQYIIDSICLEMDVIMAHKLLAFGACNLERGYKIKLVFFKVYSFVL